MRSSSSPVPPWTLAGLVALATVAVFQPALWNDFVDWDDPEMVIWNRGAHGLGLSNLVFAFTSTWFRHYHPLTWLSYGLDYTVWGLDPLGYHLTNVLLHALVACALFLLARRLLQAARRESGLAIDMAAAVVALAFALHPLRVEVAAWVTGRRDVLSGLFFFATLLAYVRAVSALDTGERPAYRRRLVLAIVLYLAGLMSKAIVMTLPAVLVILDWYPLRRSLRDRRVWLEKLPFAALGAAGAATAAWAVTAEEFSDASPAQRLAMAAYSIVFYVRKTISPTGLVAMYELPQQLDPLEARFVSSAVLTVAVTAAAILMRRRSPWLAAAWAYYVVTLLPVSGLTHAGHQLVYLRYSYLPCAVWALLIGGTVCAAVAAGRAARLGKALVAAVCIAMALMIAGWAQLARWQVQTWQSGETLWTAAIAADSSCAICHHNLGVFLILTRRPEEGERELRRALMLRPTYALAARNLASALRERGLARYAARDYAAAVDLFGEALALVPGNPELLERLAISRAALDARPAGEKTPG